MKWFRENFLAEEVSKGGQPALREVREEFEPEQLIALLLI